MIPKVLHLEPTTVCQAACPQCPRTYLTNYDIVSMSLSKAKETFSVEFIQTLEKLFMCGNLGDPAAAEDTIEIYKYFRQHNPTIVLGMNTNGGLRNRKFWTQLGQLFSNPFDYVVFSIDGLEDTNHIYRKNVNWQYVIDNAKTFIAAGGNAHWDMLVFEHNEHQVNDCARLAKDLGFSWFRAKVSKRHNEVPVEFLRPPRNWVDPVVESVEIDCHALKEQSVYVDAQGRWFPCCWHGLSQPNGNVSNWLTQLKNSWASSPDPICKTTCGTRYGQTSFSNQWQQEIELTNYKYD